MPPLRSPAARWCALLAVCFAPLLVAPEADAQAPPNRPYYFRHSHTEVVYLRPVSDLPLGVNGRVSSRVRDLLATEPPRAYPQPLELVPDSADRRAAVREMDRLRARARALGAARVPAGSHAAMLARWSVMVRQVIALTPRVRRVVALRDPALTSEALVLLGDAFEDLARRTRRAFRLPPLDRAVSLVPNHEYHCGRLVSREEEEVLTLWDEIRTTPVPRPDLLRRLGVLTAHFRRVANERRRELGVLGPEDAIAVMAEWVAMREVALLYFVSAFHMSLAGQGLAPRPWHALDRVQEDDFNLLRYAMGHGPRDLDVHAWFALRQPGRTLLEPSVLRFAPLAP